jgi:hypothetical protein
MNDIIFNNMLEVYNSLSVGINKRSTEENLKEAFTRAVAPYITAPKSLIEKPPDFKAHPEYIAFKSHADSSAKRCLAIGMHEDIKGLIGAGYDYYIPFPPVQVDAPDEATRAFEAFFAGIQGPGVQRKTAWKAWEAAWEKAKKDQEKNK